jgi:hypothetical protein
MSDQNLYVTDNTGRTEQEIKIINLIKGILPLPFKKDLKPEDLDSQILFYADLCIGYINIVPPQSGLTLQNYPMNSNSLRSLLSLGTNAYILLFKQQKWTMNDFSYNNNGMSLTIDRVDKLDKSIERFFKLFDDQTKQLKTNLMIKNMHIVATPRLGAVLGNAVRNVLGQGL